MRRKDFMRLIPVVFLSLAFIFSLLSCSMKVHSPDETALTVASYNVQLLFDDVDDGDEFSPFRKYEGWNTEKYIRRLERLRQMVKSHIDADIVFFQEIESEKVLEDLLDSSLVRRGYVYYGIADKDNPISVGFISKYNPVSVTVHQIGTQRLVMRCEFLIRGRQLVFYVLHAKSQRGEGEENASLRKDYAALLNSLARQDANACVIILGDFNSEPGYLCNDMLDAGGLYTGEETARRGSIPVTGNRFLADEWTFYDPLCDPSQAPGGAGTYFYEGKFYDYDRILINSTLAASDWMLDFSIITAVNFNDLYPYAYDAETHEGYSDHFPVKLTIR